MSAPEWLSESFEENRGRLRAVAYRMLGSSAEADDAVQDAWLRVARAGADDVDNVAGWLTTVVARVCLNMLRSRSRRREDPLDFHLPDPVVRDDDPSQPEDAAVLADSVGLALLVVLDTLSPAERLAFVLHDMFDLGYDDIGQLLDRTPDATKQLTSRARRRVRGTDAERGAPREAVPGSRSVVDAFFAATRTGDLTELARVLDPDVELRIDAGDNRPALSMALRGAEPVAAQTMRGLKSSLVRPDVRLVPVMVNDGPGVVALVHGRPVSVVGFVVADGRIVRIDAIADPSRVRAAVAAVIDRGEPDGDQRSS